MWKIVTGFQEFIIKIRKDINENSRLLDITV